MKKRIALLALAVVVLGVLWWRTGVTALSDTLARLRPGWLALALGLFVPQVLLSALRWTWVVGAYQPLAFARSLRTVLAASALNVILPSKLGDVLKGATLARDGDGGDVRTGLLLGVFEKALDTAALGVVLLVATAWAWPTEAVGAAITIGCVGGVLAFAYLCRPAVARRLAPHATSTRTGVAGKGVRLLGAVGAVVLRVAGQRRRMALLVASALLLWTLHVLQFVWMHRAAGGAAPDALVWSRVPMALFVGLLPVTFAGIGTRDAALVYLLAAASGEGPALALGVLGTLRYVVPALAGLPFLSSLRAGRSEVTPG